MNLDVEFSVKIPDSHVQVYQVDLQKCSSQPSICLLVQCYKTQQLSYSWFHLWQLKRIYLLKQQEHLNLSFETLFAFYLQPCPEHQTKLHANPPLFYCTSFTFISLFSYKSFSCVYSCVVWLCLWYGPQVCNNWIIIIKKTVWSFFLSVNLQQGPVYLMTCLCLFS